MYLNTVANLKKNAVIYNFNNCMKKSMHKLGKRLVFLLGIIIFFLVLFLLFVHFTDYKPSKEEPLFFSNSGLENIEDQSTFSILSWNIGYCGLGKEMDFFYDGGKQVRPSKSLFKKNLKKNLEFIHSINNIDFLFFQEVDKHSKRSYYIDQSKKLDSLLQNHSSIFTTNYKVPFVPMPILNPMGSVEAGIMTFYKFKSTEATRFAYPNLASWPNNLFLLDRCFILTRHPLPSGKELILINTHNSYYVSNDSLRKLELNILKKKMIEEYNKGNYVIAGGDWNKYPPHFLEHTNIPSNLLQTSIHSLENNFLPPNWNYAFDANIPSNRELKTSYKKDETKLAVIDFFIVSPNIKIINYKTYFLGFESSDHHPTKLEISLIY